MNAVEVLECREYERCAIHTVWGFSFAFFTNSYMHKLYSTKVHFYVKSIGASPVVIAREMEKLFKFLHSQTECNPTIGS